MLELQGLVEVRKGSGIYALPKAATHSQDAIAAIQEEDALYLFAASQSEMP